MRDENDKLQASMRKFTGEDLTSLTLNDLNNLEDQLEYSLNKVRTRKVCEELLDSDTNDAKQIDNSYYYYYFFV